MAHLQFSRDPARFEGTVCSLVRAQCFVLCRGFTCPLGSNQYRLLTQTLLPCTPLPRQKAVNSAAGTDQYFVTPQSHR
jgi:hypothetical protein